MQMAMRYICYTRADIFFFMGDPKNTSSGSSFRLPALHPGNTICGVFFLLRDTPLTTIKRGVAQGVTLLQLREGCEYAENRIT